jgi:hypothetical protein
LSGFELERQEKALFPEVEFNRPERKSGRLGLVGGRNGALAAASKAYELALKIGAEEVLLNQVAGDGVLVLGDLDKNAAKTQQLEKELTEFTESGKPVIITRDAVDLLQDWLVEQLGQPNLTVIMTFNQLQKVFKAVLYPKVLVMSLPLMTFAETLHKFTMSYAATVATVFNGELLVASGGRVVGTDLALSKYNPLTIWSGELAVVSAMNELGKNAPLPSVAAAVLMN